MRDAGNLVGEFGVFINDAEVSLSVCRYVREGGCVAPAFLWSKCKQMPEKLSALSTVCDYTTYTFQDILMTEYIRNSIHFLYDFRFRILSVIHTSLTLYYVYFR